MYYLIQTSIKANNNFYEKKKREREEEANGQIHFPTSVIGP